MTFNAGVPIGAQTISGNGPGFRTNFSKMDAAFSADHSPFASATNIGLHKQVSFIGVDPQAAIPVTLEGITLIAEFKAAPKNKFVLHYQQNSAAGGGSDASYQFSNSSVPILATRGASYMPGEAFFQWGTDTLTGDLTAFNFPIPYDADAYSVVVTGHRSNAGTYDICIDSGSITAGGFTVRRASSSSITKITWMAIGPKS